LLITTYNVLADAYIKPEWYPHTPAEILEFGTRQQALVNRIKALDADVVCMQEVEPSLMEALSAAFEPQGYAIEYAQKSRHKPDGSATLIRGGALESRSLYFDDNPGKKPSGHVALIVKADLGGRTLTVVNTHLRWNPPGQRGADHIGYRQIEELLRHCSPDPMVVCGDLNVTAESDTIQRLLQAGLVDAFCQQPDAWTCNPNGIAKRIDFLFSSPQLKAQCQPLPEIDDNTPLPSASEPSDHLPVSADFMWVD
jgi:mRNA deadenylase 3'-5' endonuclease subunit Ccr4